MRVGVYSDLVYRFDGEVFSTDQPFIRYVTNLGERVDEVVIFGRLAPERGREAYLLDGPKIRFVPFPHYPNGWQLGKVVGALAGSRHAFTAALSGLDVVLLFGPYPVAFGLAEAAIRRGTPVVLGVRQDYPSYIESRLPSRRWAWAVPAARALDEGFRRLARTRPTVVIGASLAENYRGSAPRLVTGVSLVKESEIASSAEAAAKDWNGERRLLTVGRVDAEKNPLLLPEILVELGRHPGQWRLAVAGVGPLEHALAEKARSLGVADRLELLGHVPNGPELWQQYRQAHAFLHVSFTEGLPQVLHEAQAAGLPIVATDVGGVAAALGDGRDGLLVPPADAAAAASALIRLADEPELRSRLAAVGLARARAESMEAQLDRLVAFLGEAVKAS